MDAAEPVFELDGESGSLRILARDVWASRDVIRVLARKDFFVQYRRASFGVVWALALPLLQAGVLAIVVPKVVQFDTSGSYLTFVFGGTIAWTLFASSLVAAAGSIVDGQAISTRVYFPRIVLPVQSVLSRLYGFLPAAALLVVLTVVTGSGGPQLVLLVPATVVAVLLTTSMSAFFAAAHVYFRDVRYIVQAALLAWFYVSPVIYPLTAVPTLRPWLEANPVTGVIELFRLATVGADPTWPTALAWTALWTTVFAVLSLVIHRRFDRLFVDRL